MGTCSSCSRDSTSVVPPTAKLILQNGHLQEFTYPIKVRHVSPRDPTAFICHSDEIGLDELVSAMRPEDELRLGHLYFALPLGRLRSPLRSDEMAKLVAKASSVLVKDEDRKHWFCCSRIPEVAGDDVAMNEVDPRGKRNGFTSKLYSIIE